ncbi:DENN domain-containing protein 1B [Chanos chanos]|uniref:DENN domain-containing protein 1B n=1 Tax=Chanos chanos TaxID=29144 RepID=A0A6J2W7E4_CHACN|nr:DENN domain-containing protein 1B [Chanos chanos]
MDSRIKENPERTFELALQVACPSSEDEDPTVLWKFPQDFGDQGVLQTVPKFCFPFDLERVSQNQVGQNFTFVLTDIDSKQRFGFCRLTSGCRVCICLLSYLPWFEIYYKLLNTLADYLSKHQENDLNDMLESLHSLPVPKPHTPVNLSVHSYFIAPDLNGLPTIPESRNLTEYFVAVDVNNMLQLYASMLHERRIIITSSKLSTLTACVHGSASMLYPMYWQHIYIPVIPPHLLDYCCAPMPYLIGVHLSLLDRVKSRSLEDVVILNVDTNTLECPSDDLRNLPSDVISTLKSKLKKQSTATGSGVARAFLRAQAALFGSYRDALRYKPGEPITFCEESFVAHRSSTMRNFLEMAVNLQLFKQFIDGRLAKLNAGRGFTDVFEEEITHGGFSGSSSKSYQQWMHTVKSKERASPVMKTAYKQAKSRAKRGITEMKSKLKTKETDEENSPVRPGSPTSTKSLSPRRHHRRSRYHPHRQFPTSVCDIDDDELDNASKVSSEDSGEVRSFTEDSDDDSYELDMDTEKSGQMNLLEEILDSLSTSNIEQSKLSAAKSLDFFRSIEDIDYSSSSTVKSPRSSSPAHIGSSGCSGSGDPGSWNLGQDDSAVHGKHLPPSPRRRASPNSQPAPAPPQIAISTAEPSESPPRSPNAKETHPPAPLLSTLQTETTSSAAVRSESPPESPQSSDSQQPACTALRRKILSKETLKHYQELAHSMTAAQGGRQSSVLVPWEKEEGAEEEEQDDKGSREEETNEEKGLLEEIESVCRFSMALNTNLFVDERTQIHNNSVDKS